MVGKEATGIPKVMQSGRGLMDRYVYMYLPCVSVRGMILFAEHVKEGGETREVRVRHPVVGGCALDGVLLQEPRGVKTDGIKCQQETVVLVKTDTGRQTQAGGGAQWQLSRQLRLVFNVAPFLHVHGTSCMAWSPFSGSLLQMWHRFRGRLLGALWLLWGVHEVWRHDVV